VHSRGLPTRKAGVPERELVNGADGSAGQACWTAIPVRISGSGRLALACSVGRAGVESQEAVPRPGRSRLNEAGRRDCFAGVPYPALEHASSCRRCQQATAQARRLIPALPDEGRVDRGGAIGDPTLRGVAAPPGGARCN